MRVLIVSPEAEPYFKSGGLGDVAGSLARALARRGHDVRLAMPRYRFIDAGKFGIRPLMPEILVNVEGQSTAGAIDVASLDSRGFPTNGVSMPNSARGPNGKPKPNGKIAPAAATAYFVRCDKYFDRGGAYGETVGGRLRDYPDNAERFGFFCMAVIWMLKGLGWRPDVIHCNDWQSALVPIYLRTNPWVVRDPFYKGIKVLLSIHNLAFQGAFPAGMLPRIGLARDVFTLDGLEFHGGINLLKGGILYSDRITTVSRRYAGEIQTREFGCGLDGLLRSRRSRLTGILNGIDTEVWNPETDPRLPARYSADNLSGKAECKRALQKEFGLAQHPNVPLLGIVSRLSTQKGYELIDASLTPMVEMGVQLVMLGNGEPRYHRMLERMARRHPDNVAARLVFSDGCAHRIEAGADMFLMPSYYEPCGLNQMFSMRYGTPPVVRRTGGLADSVVNCSPATLRSGRATGFVFANYSPMEFLSALNRALQLYRESPDVWRRLMLAGMKKDFSWDSVAGKYEALYEKLMKEKPRRPA